MNLQVNVKHLHTDGVGMDGLRHCAHLRALSLSLSRDVLEACKERPRLDYVHQISSFMMIH